MNVRNVSVMIVLPDIPGGMLAGDRCYDCGALRIVSELCKEPFCFMCMVDRQTAAAGRQALTDLKNALIRKQMRDSGIMLETREEYLKQCVGFIL